MVGNRLRGSSYSICYVTHMKTKLYICYKCVGCSVSVNSHGPRIVDSVGPLVVSLTPPSSSILPLFLLTDSVTSARWLAVWLCLYLHQLLVKKTVMLGSCRKAQQNIITSVRSWLFPMGWISSWINL